jgi:SpoVK/Ycf46/Vps4 family AAA+-type ATPase
MNDDDLRLIGMLRRVLRDCGKLYRQCGTWLVRRYPTLLDDRADQFVALMDDLHRGLLIKVYVTVVRADDRWTSSEKKVAAAMIEYLWGEELRGAELREAATGLFHQADNLTWESLVAPFVRYEPLADSKTQVETVVMRLANLVAKCDGNLMPEESVALHTLQREIDMALHPADPERHLPPLPISGKATAKQQEQQQANQSVRPTAELSDQERKEQLNAAIAELDELIGLSTVKDRVRSYANFLELQRQRQQSGLATMPISLHMTFIGNPGTGKTTVARIVGQILGALGTLPSGHVVETDRSGLVADYAGQTATKTNKLCDSAIGGVLFIDEAYSLIDASGDDAYGREAIQSLLKRMEDDRDKMAVILAGYSNEMRNMIRSNPGLSSRINTTIEFEDYTPAELGRIFETMCYQNQYELPADARYRLLIAFDHLYQNRDRHFGNGRLARNVFEDSVRKLADRIAGVSQVSESLLTKLTLNDVSIPELSSSQIDELTEQPHELRIQCEGCNRKIRIQPQSLGQRVKCGTCKHIQVASWADVRR